MCTSYLISFDILRKTKAKVKQSKLKRPIDHLLHHTYKGFSAEPRDSIRCIKKTKSSIQMKIFQTIQ